MVPKPKNAQRALAILGKIWSPPCSTHLLDVDGCRVNRQLFISGVELDTVDRRNLHFELFNFKKFVLVNPTTVSACVCKASIADVTLLYEVMYVHAHHSPCVDAFANNTQ